MTIPVSVAGAGVPLPITIKLPLALTPCVPDVGRVDRLMVATIQMETAYRRSFPMVAGLSANLLQSLCDSVGK